MMRNKHRRLRSFLICFAVFLVVSGAAFLGFQFFTKTGIFKVPGVVYYDEGLTTEELSTLDGIFTEEVVLDSDVTISAYESQTRPELGEGEFLYSITVPVTDYYDARMDTSEFEKYDKIPIDELDYNKKLLSINGDYYLDTFNSGAEFRVIKFESESYAKEIEPLVSAQFTKVFPDQSSVLSFAQTGVTALSRGMNSKLNAVGDAKYFAEGIGDYLSGFDLTHTSNESSFSDYASSSNICSDPRFIDTLTAIGLDIVELTGNHNQDCGNQAAIDTIDIYGQNNIQTVGGGKTAADAAVPLEIQKKGTGITFLAYNESTGGATYGNSPGANQYDENNLVTEIAAAKKRGDFIIVDIQYYECSSYDYSYENETCDYANSSAGDQVGLFRHIIDLGANMVVGTSAHQPQTFELYGDGVIYYGLGNLFFDQSWWPGTTRSLILAHYFYDGKLLQTKIVPTVYDGDLQTRLLDKETSEWFINRLAAKRP